MMNTTKALLDKVWANHRDLNPQDRVSSLLHTLSRFPRPPPTCLADGPPRPDPPGRGQLHAAHATHSFSHLPRLFTYLCCRWATTTRPATCCTCHSLFPTPSTPLHISFLQMGRHDEASYMLHMPLTLSHTFHTSHTFPADGPPRPQPPGRGQLHVAHGPDPKGEGCAARGAAHPH